MKRASEVIHPISDSKIFVNASSAFDFKPANGTSWATTVNNTSYVYPLNAFIKGITAKEYFEGMEKTSSYWNDAYGKYFS